MSNSNMKTILVQLFVSYFLFFAFATESVHGAQSFIKCPLVWKNFASGGKNVSDFSVPVTTSLTNHYIVRGILPGQDKYTVGRYELDTSQSFFPLSNENVISMEFFQILTNPHGCIINWKKTAAGGPHQIPSDTGASTFVGRAGHESNYISGQVSGNQITVATPVGAITLTTWQILEAYSLGLSLQMKKFVFEGEAFQGTNDFVGIDLIHNGGDTEITQTITQKKKILQRSEIEKTSGWDNSLNWKIDVSPELKYKTQDEDGNEKNITASGPSFGYEGERKDGKTTEDVQIYENDMVIEVTRVVVVPPYTSVQVCSTVTLVKDFSTAFIARAEYTGPGLTAREVADILKLGTTEYKTEGKMVVVEERGTFAGTMALNTKFIVADADDPNGCSAISR